jgi:DNA mismatch endonuclease (patch repair protein)
MGRSSQQVSDIMRRVRGTNTKPELALRKALWGKGLRYRLHDRNLPGKPDIVFPKARVAVFVDGDFWHGNQWRKRGKRALAEQFGGSEHSDYWQQKIGRNMDRDAARTSDQPLAMFALVGNPYRKV